MCRGAVIAGTVRDQFGVPVASSQVTVKQPIVINGQRRLIDVPNLLVPWATTDDKGRYRIFGRPPGEHDQDLSGIVLQFERDVSVAGRVVPPAASIRPDRTFRFDGIGPGTWRVTGVLPAGWSLRSAIVNGRDT